MPKFEFAGKSRRKSDAESILANYPGGYMELKGVEWYVFRLPTKELRGNALGHGDSEETEKPEPKPESDPVKEWRSLQAQARKRLYRYASDCEI